MDIKIKNKKTYTGEGFYIGRPSPLGNPFKISQDQTRKECILRYENWILEEIHKNNLEILNALDELFNSLIDNQELYLICWCSPKLCHGNVIKDILLNKYYYGDYI